MTSLHGATLVVSRWLKRLFGRRQAEQPGQSILEKRPRADSIRCLLSRQVVCGGRSAALHCMPPRVSPQRQLQYTSRVMASIHLQVQVRDWGSGNPNDLGDLEVAVGVELSAQCHGAPVPAARQTAPDPGGEHS